eukprot:gene29534-5880_t
MRGSAVPKSGKRLRLLDLMTYALIAMALIFSIYCLTRNVGDGDHHNAPRVLLTDKKEASQAMVLGHVLVDEVHVGDYSTTADEGVLVEERVVGHKLRSGALPDSADTSSSRSHLTTADTSANSLDSSAHTSSPTEGGSTSGGVSSGGVLALAHMQNPRLYHTITSAAGFSNHWQARIHYFWFKKQRDRCLTQGTLCDMGGFTRLLHTGESDDLMDEVPTVVVDPLPKEIMKDSSYIVLNRPYAFMEWIKTASIPEK